MLLLAGAVGFFLLSRSFAGDAAKATPRLAQTWTDGTWAPVKDYAAFGMYWFAIGNAVLLALAAATSPLWHRRWQAPAAEVSEAPQTGSGRSRWLYPLSLVACLALALGLRWTTFTGGFWHDEGLQMKRVSGSHDAGKGTGEGGGSVFREASWHDTWFHFRKPTNHTVIGVPARACLESWRSTTGADRWEFREWVVRLPSMVYGLATILLVAALARRFGGTTAGLVAAVLLAVHPWHIQWGVDARSYSAGIFAAALAAWTLIKGLDSGKWRWWLGFGLAQALLLWASLMHLWVSVAFFLAAIMVVVGARKQRPMFPQFGRLVLSNVVGATVFLQVMGPNLLQFLHASKTRAPAEEEFMKLDPGNLSDFLSHLFLGLPHDVPTQPGDHAIVTWTSLFGSAPVAGWCLIGVSVLLAIGGWLWAIKRHHLAGWILMAVPLAGIAHLLITAALDWYYYPRFSTFLLPAVVVGWAIVWSHLAGKAWRRGGGLAMALPAALGFFLATAMPQVANLVRNPHEPFPEIRDAFANLREAGPGGQALTAGYGLGSDILHDIYDPKAKFISSRQELEELIQVARESKSPLYVVYGLQSFNRATVPDGFTLLDDARFFSKIRRFQGNDPRHTFFLLRYEGE
ncbi:MAG: glycosyltransferase family 39 protein [Verrucomicrobiales bacterium]